MYSTFDVADFPWPLIGMWSACGLVAGMLVKVCLWRKTLALVTFLYAAIGAALGAFVGLVYYSLDGISNRGQW
jgi:hypothetical protein